MGEYSINIVKKNVDKELFLRLPSKIYDEKHIVQNKTFENKAFPKKCFLLPLFLFYCPFYPKAFKMHTSRSLIAEKNI